MPATNERTERLRQIAGILVSCLLIAGIEACEVGAPSADTTSGEPNLAIVDKFLDATHVQQEALRGAEMEVDIDATLPRLEKHGKLRALRTISKLGRITYKALGFSGDNTVKQEVISRYLQAESEARDSGSLAITPANYKFRYSGRIVQDGRTMQVLEVTPRKKAVGLFKGEIWIDAETGMPIREAGTFVKSPSVFLKKIEFVRDFQMENGVSLPAHISSTVDTRIVGKAELQISFSNYTKHQNAGEGDPGAESSILEPSAQSGPQSQ
jgi:hypothetical protein